MKRLVMVGCGKFSRHYHVQTLLADKRTQLVGIYDPHPAPEVHDIIKRTGALLVDRLEQLPDADAALITTPHGLHTQHIAFALEKGWATLVDKPFVLDFSDGRRLVEMARSRQLLNAVGFNRRLDSGCLRAKEVIASGQLGAELNTKPIPRPTSNAAASTNGTSAVRWSTPTGSRRMTSRKPL